ncbi:kinase-like domain-containing protein [Hysterangium stoloniferum]|nr:kinase-like domain-containing protein [Hysterangium stoloniferum]
MTFPHVPHTLCFETCQVRLLGILGSGGGGKVYYGLLNKKGMTRECAVKCSLKVTRDPYSLLLVSDNKGVVSIYDTFEDDTYQWLITEYCAGGDLWTAVVQERFSGNDNYLRHIFLQILECVDYCHSRHVFHRDIKPENILLTKCGQKALLADFGLATSLKTTRDTRCGSTSYMSPECWGGLDGRDLPYETAPNDMWALGILLINMACSLQVPWTTATSHDPVFCKFMESPQSVLKSMLPVSRPLCSLLVRVLALAPKQRISIQEFYIAVSQTKHFTLQGFESEEFGYERTAFASL